MYNLQHRYLKESYQICQNVNKNMPSKNEEPFSHLLNLMYPLKSNKHDHFQFPILYNNIIFLLSLL